MRTGVMSIDLHNQQQKENLKAHKMYCEAYAEYMKTEKKRMKQPSKQELRDRIAFLERAVAHDATMIKQWRAEYTAEFERRTKLKTQAKRATLAAFIAWAYALALTLWVVL